MQRAGVPNRKGLQIHKENKPPDKWAKVSNKHFAEEAERRARSPAAWVGRLRDSKQCQAIILHLSQQQIPNSTSIGSGCGSPGILTRLLV